jgi:hypothetical protein
LRGEAATAARPLEDSREVARVILKAIPLNLPADAGRFMTPEILKYRLVCDVAAGSAEVAPRPEMATPVTFAKFWELHLNAMRRAPFGTANEVADRDMRWYLDEHVDMLFGQNA